MSNVKTIARILLYISRFFAAFYFFISAYAAICLLTGWSLSFKEERKFFSVLYPFSAKPFLNGYNNVPYILFDFLIPLTLYGLFFWLAGNVFNVFTKPKLFTKHGIKKLRQFYLCNLIIPPLAVLLSSIFSIVEDDVVLFIVPHFTLGVFAYFLAAIFKQGLNIQNEQDLII